MAKSSMSGGSGKSLKPYPGFPLTPHPSGRWCKKIKGKLHYFGKIDNPEAALERFNREWPYLKDGRTPPAVDTGDGCTVKFLCNSFLAAKKSRVESGELSSRSFNDYFRTCKLMVAQLGSTRRVDDLRTEDFEALRGHIASTRELVGIKNEVNRCRIVLKYAYSARLIDRPVHFGSSFDRPSTMAMRKAKRAGGPTTFQAEEARKILAAADTQIKAMVLLGLNCGFGNTDCASLPLPAINLESGWVEFPRPKTAVDRRSALWPETVAAVKAALLNRPEPRNAAESEIIFLTRHGRRWVREQKRGVRGQSEGIGAIDALSQRFAKLLKRLGINSHRNFYTLRHTFETVAGESKDQVAVDSIMGHVDPSMGAQYRPGRVSESVSDSRLLAVAKVVHSWLFA